MRNILRRPILTEKSTALNEKGIYVFIVDKAANKLEIKNAIKELYPTVTVEQIRTATIWGKPKMRYVNSIASKGHSSTYKKAYVQLAEGDVIDFLEEGAQ